MRERLTDALVASIEANGRDQFIFDTMESGFFLRVTPARRKILGVQTRDGRRKPRVTIGFWPDIKVAEGRDRARVAIANIKAGLAPKTSHQRSAHPAGLTITDFSARWMAEHVRAKLKPKTGDDYEDILRRHILPRFGRRPLASIGFDDLNAMHVALKKTPGMANRALNVTQSMYAYAVRLDIVSKNPAAGIGRYPERVRQRFLAESEYPIVFDAIDRTEREGAINCYGAAAIKLLIYTGARRSEITNAKWSEVDWDRRFIHRPTSKTGKARTLHLNDAAIAVLKALPRSGSFIIAGGRDSGPNPNVSYYWDYIRSRCGLTDVRLHDLRHSFASTGLASGLSLPVIGKLLGHAKASTTSRYAHLCQDVASEAADLIGAAMQAAIVNTAEANVVRLPKRRAKS
jgi:integrase